MLLRWPCIDIVVNNAVVDDDDDRVGVVADVDADDVVDIAAIVVDDVVFLVGLGAVGFDAVVNASVVFLTLVFPIRLLIILRVCFFTLML